MFREVEGLKRTLDEASITEISINIKGMTFIVRTCGSPQKPSIVQFHRSA